jgi:myosin heavy subunit
VAEWKAVKRKLDVLGFSGAQQAGMFGLFAGALNLSSVTFEEGSEDGSKIGDLAALKTCTALLQVDEKLAPSSYGQGVVLSTSPPMGRASS